MFIFIKLISAQLLVALRPNQIIFDHISRKKEIDMWKKDPSKKDLHFWACLF